MFPQISILSLTFPTVLFQHRVYPQDRISFESRSIVLGSERPCIDPRRLQWILQTLETREGNFNSWCCRRHLPGNLASDVGEILDQQRFRVVAVL